MKWQAKQFLVADAENARPSAESNIFNVALQ